MLPVRSKKMSVVLCAVGTLGLAIGIGWLPWRAAKFPKPPTEEAQPNQSSPYRNVRAEVHYVGNEVCATCHPSHAETYRHHPMSHSFAPVAHGSPATHDDSYVSQSFQVDGFDYLVEHRGSVLVHREARRDAAGKVVAEAEAEVQFTIGSGAHGATYVVRHEDYLFQSPISWYAATQTLALAPSHQQHNLHFERRIDDNCLFCHCDDARPVEHSLNRFQQPISSRYGIGCERCHGPGELHVQRYKKGGIHSGADDTIVNPRRLEPNLREAVCEQCHLQGANRVLRRGRQPHDYRPGLPLQHYWTVFVHRAGSEKLQRAVSQVEQLHESRCFRESKGELGCISCHNPHALPGSADRIAIFRARCLNCHQDTSCRETPERRLALSNADDCTACHMPRRKTKDIAHAAITDHRILRRPPADFGVQKSVASLPDDIPVPFYLESSGALGADLDRDLGIALTQWPGTQQQRALAEQALSLLESSLRNWPNDIAGMEAKGLALRLTGRPREALQAFQDCLSGEPEDEFALLSAAETSAQLGNLDAARSYFRHTGFAPF